MIVSNATPLIYLAKIERLELLKKAFKEVAISEEVKKEVVDEGKRLHKSDALLVEKAIEAGWIKVKKASSLAEIQWDIEKGEKSVIALAKETGTKEVLIDESAARTAAKLSGLIPRGTVFVLLKALKMKEITFDEFLKCLEELVKKGFRLSEEIYIKAIEEARKISA